MREFLLKNTGDLKVINAIESVFSQASVDTCLLLFKKIKPTDVEVGELKMGENPVLFKHSVKDFYQNDFVIKIGQEKTGEKLEFKNTIPLGEISTVSTGLKAYQIGKGKPIQNKAIKETRIFHSNIKKDKTYRSYLQGVDVKRYFLDWVWRIFKLRRLAC